MEIYNDDDRNIFKDIEMYKGLIKKKEEEIKYLEIDKDCITLSLINRIKNIPSIPIDWDKVTKYFYNKDKYKEYKRIYDEFRHILYSFFKLPTNLKIDKIYTCGYERYGCEVIFTKNKKKYFIFIPVHKMCNMSNYVYMYYGQYVFGYYESECSSVNHLYTYDPSDIVKVLEEFKIIKENKNG